MANANREDFVTPVGRIVQGSLYIPRTKDGEQKPLMYKSGDKKGEPRSDYYVALAVPKGQETHWAQTPWGQKIWNVAHKGFTQTQCQAPSFAWKITDGDSLIPNSKGTVPAKCEGFPGHWILRFSGSQAPTLLRLNKLGKTEAFLDKDAIMPGDYVEIACNVTDNESQQRPGVYLNHNMICFRATGDRIITGVDPDSVGFGQAPLPPGVTVVPTNSVMAPMETLAVPMQGYAVPTTVTVPVMPPIPPHPGILNQAPPPPVPVAQPQRVMTAIANGLTYEQYINNGWTDTQLIQNGLMMP